RQSGNAAQPLPSRHEKGRQKGISELDDMACASHQVVIPITGWENNLAVLPLRSEQRILDFYSGRSSTERSYDRGYNLSVESYLIPSSVRTNSCKRRDGLIFLKAECYRTKKKNEKPYRVIAAVNQQAAIIDGNCDCAAGKLACNHLMGMLRTVLLLQKKGFLEAPEQLSCTDIPQQWRVPRHNSPKGSPIQSIDWRSVREGGLSVPKLARPNDRRLCPRNEQQQEAATSALATKLLSVDP
ncbi:hypothetical protein HPB47_019315, partial [Ixodes persulcatus]